MKHPPLLVECHSTYLFTCLRSRTAHLVQTKVQTCINFCLTRNMVQIFSKHH